MSNPHGASTYGIPASHGVFQPVRSGRAVAAEDVFADGGRDEIDETLEPSLPHLVFDRHVAETLRVKRDEIELVLELLAHEVRALLGESVLGDGDRRFRVSCCATGAS